MGFVKLLLKKGYAIDTIKVYATMAAQAGVMPSADSALIATAVHGKTNLIALRDTGGWNSLTMPERYYGSQQVANRGGIVKGHVIEIGIINLAGKVLFHSLINPEQTIMTGARLVHSFTDEEAPTLPEVWNQLRAALTGTTLLIAYNVDSNASVDVDAAQRGVYQMVKMWKSPTQAWKKYQIGDASVEKAC